MQDEKQEKKQKKKKANEEYQEVIRNKQALLEKLGVDASAEIYKKLIDLAKDGDKEAMKFVANRTVPNRWAKFIHIPNCPPIDSIDNIQKATEIIHTMLINGELTIDEVEGLMAIYENVRAIIATQQFKVIADEINLIKENVHKTLSISTLGQEIKERFVSLEHGEKLDKFINIFEFSLDDLMEMITKKIETQDDKLKLLKLTKDICK